MHYVTSHTLYHRQTAKLKFLVHGYVEQSAKFNPHQIFWPYDVSLIAMEILVMYMHGWLQATVFATVSCAC